MMAQTVKVWDIFVRACHWSLVMLFVVAYGTGDEQSRVHAYAGYGILALVAARVAWGFIGPRRARFSDFLRAPAAALGYLRALATGNASRRLGHNPAGGWMVVMLLAALLVTGASGLIVYGLEGHGPLAAGFDARSPLAEILAPAGVEAAEDVWEEVHEVLANLTVLLVLLHVLGVVVSSLAHRENLVWSMLTGRKRARCEGGTAPDGRSLAAREGQRSV